MTTLYFDNLKEIANDAIDMFESIKEISIFPCVTIVAKYDAASDILKTIFSEGYDVHSVDIKPQEFEDYYDEYYIDITNIGIFCYKAKRSNNTYLINDPSACYLLEDCNSKILTRIKCDKIIECYFDDCEYIL